MFPQSEAVEMQMNIDKASLCQRFLQHSYERRKLLKRERTRKITCTIDGLSTIFDFARVCSSRKHPDKAVHENSPRVFLTLCFTQVRVVV